MTSALHLARVEWMVTPAGEQDTKGNTFGQECDECGAGSPRTHDPNDGTLWIIAHVGMYASHTSFTEVVKRPWRAYTI